ncbi:carboxylesterase/lipase family protein [Saccharopolyspora mangrovi]|uniref:Carboxylic ester hydrolase n=1 Tax=Saccharopolyspora mangrovi TaxID=3082379 RepID=A0ABU6AJ42_9PSEU|nr:carboxylesterase family protein [Saccharopolyspora sp. S2-29]MEB3371540.1 carboxylesterase family protein [Saccharopolyspora sp. S2-29]
MHSVVRTQCGAVRGTADGDVQVFKGIPFAAPLDGPRRFQAPAEPESWDGERDATRYSAAVPQPLMAEGLPPSWHPGDDTDSLTVNVWTPVPGANLPVMVWFHGGAYLAGSPSEGSYEGARLAGSGVVVVTAGYRVGYEGFGWVDDAPANRGILDQLAALRWVRENIGAFGGDPDNVTIFGESAGGTSIATLVAGSSRSGLFRRAIAQSPAAMYRSEDEARKIAELITGPSGVRTTVAELANIPAEDLHAAQKIATAEMTRNHGSWTDTTPYGVVLDGETLGELPWVALRDGAARGVDLISGFTAEEAALFTAMLPREALDPDQLAADLHLGDDVMQQYRRAHPGIGDVALYNMLLSDKLFRIPALWMAEAHAAAGGRSYLYELTLQALNGLGACHALDIPFTFGDVTSPVLQVLGGAPDGFEDLSGEFRRSWTAFAATGDPGWEAYRPSDRRTRIFDLPCSTTSDPIAASREIWAHRFPELTARA